MVLVLLLAIVVGAALRWHGITDMELQYDEAATGYFAGLPWADLWGGPAVLEPNPPLFYSLARLVTLGGGDVEHIRYVSAAAGTLCIPAAWLLGRLLAGRFAAGAAAWLVATSPQNIAFSQYARAYALLSLLLLCALLCLVLARRATSARSGVWWWVCYVAVSAASLYLHYTAIVILAAIIVSALLSSLGTGSPGRRFWVGLLVANAVVALAFLPWLPVLLHQAMPASTLVPAATARSTTVVQRFLSVLQRPFLFRGLPWVNVWLLPIMAFGAWRFRTSRDVIALALTSVSGPLLMFVVSQFHPMLDGKTLAWAGLFAMMCAALGLQAARLLRWPILVLLLVVQLGPDVSQARDVDAGQEGWRDVASLLNQDAKDHDVVFINDAGAILALRRYHWPEARLDVRILAKPEAEPWFRDAPGIHAAGPGAVRAAADASRVWLLTYNAPSTHQALVTQAGESLASRRLFRHAGRLDVSLLAPRGQ
jgi:4-amino-4-deoxy-L-arabinose transferase-like glycosyltransferase